MRKLNLTYLLILSLFALSITSCDDDDGDGGMSDETITEIASGNSDLTSLTAALIAAGLDDDLNSSGPFTVFAPTNDAFETFLSDNGYTDLGDVPLDLLQEVLLTHVIPDNFRSNDLQNGYFSVLSTEETSGNQNFVYINTDNGVTISGNSTVTTADIDASNGTIHIVDEVINIPTVVTQATSNDGFSSLVAALTRSDLPTDYASILSGYDNAPFTVFAPTNQAFENLLDMLELESLNDIPVEILEQVLEYHVIVSSNIRSDDLTDGTTVETLLGESIEVDLTDGPQIIDASGMNANIILADVQADNGVVHAVDKVLLPQSVVDALNPNLYTMISMDPNYSSLKAAIDRAGLENALTAEGADLTLFAPDNDAFEQLLTDLGANSLEDIPIDLLTQVLLNHVVDGSVLSTDLTAGYTSTLATEPTTGNNVNLYINLDNGVRLNGISSVVDADTEVTNGVIHGVDAVITLPTVVTFATADATFSTLVAALTRSDLGVDYVGLLSGTDNSPFTVFAPTNDAFGDLLTELMLGGLGDIDAATLNAVLQYHVVAGANVLSSTLMDGQMIETFGGSMLTVDLSDGAALTDANGRTSNIVVTDVQAYNGVIHVIDTVVLP
jgi:transforming growth factor-beta-induced protein